MAHPSRIEGKTNKVYALDYYYKNRDKILAQRKELKALRFSLPEEIKKQLESGPCEICGISGPVDIDHDHETGKFRGLLCRRCNLALGNFKDDIALMEAAIQYLKERQC